MREKRYDPIRQCAYVLYFFGLRPCEVDEELRVENGFLIARNRKRKNGKIEHKKPPVPKQAQGLIDFDKQIMPNLSYDKWLDLMKECLPDHLTSYNLRHTFATKCSEPTDIKSEIGKIWMSDRPTRLVGKHYVHYSDELMRKKWIWLNFPSLDDDFTPQMTPQTVRLLRKKQKKNPISCGYRVETNTICCGFGGATRI